MRCCMLLAFSIASCAAISLRGMSTPTCVAESNNQGIDATTCQPCAQGQTWWPCNTPYCDCSGTPGTTAAPVTTTAPVTTAVAVTTAAQVTAAPTSAAPSLAGECVALPNNQNIDAGACQPCAEGQSWWPCNTPYCDCSGASATTATAAVTTASPSTSASTPGSCGDSSLASWFTENDFANFFPNINNPACSGKGFFNWCALSEAAAAFPGFASSGDLDQDRTELAAFLAQTSHETTGGWADAPGGPQAWGYCFKEEVNCGGGACTQYCQAGNPCADQGFDCTCVPGQTYHGRGPVQLSWNYNYGYFSEVFLGDASILMQNPSLLTTDPVMAYKAALWFWMTAQAPKPSCHAVMTGLWTPSSADLALGRTPGYGMCTNIINGGIECNKPTDAKVIDRVEFFRRYTGILGVSMPDDSTLYCDQMASYR